MIFNVLTRDSADAEAATRVAVKWVLALSLLFPFFADAEVLDTQRFEAVTIDGDRDLTVTDGGFVEPSEGTAVMVADTGTFRLEGGTLLSERGLGLGVAATANSRVVIDRGMITAAGLGGIDLHDNASLRIMGGQIDSRTLGDSNVFDYFGGVRIGDTASATMTGGRIETLGGAGIRVQDNGRLNLEGGTVISRRFFNGTSASNLPAVVAAGSAYVEIRGGTLEGNTVAAAVDSGTLVISGGMIQPRNSRLGLTAIEQAVLEFRVLPGVLNIGDTYESLMAGEVIRLAEAYPAFYSHQPVSLAVTGVLADGNPLEVGLGNSAEFIPPEFNRDYPTGEIRFVVVPEPSMVVGLGIVTGIAVTRRRSR
ncbi:MAG: PEP-CTERM sorting domain-containing protein [Planctomycetota bacterium]